MTSNNIIKNILLIFVLSIFLLKQSVAQNAFSDTLAVKQEKVTIGYGSQHAWIVTSSVSHTKGSDLQKNFTPDLGNTLYGRLSGLSVSQGGGEPGLQSPGLQIRGRSTFNDGTDILILVDGFELPFGQMVPEEIESITVLKDAAATAIYGRKGANGVMLITTKQGQVSPLKINFIAQYGFNNPTHLPGFLGSYDYARLYNEALMNDGKTELYSPSDLEAYRTGSDPYFYPDVNWYDQILRTSAPTSKYNLNFSGGTQSIQYFVMLNMINADGLYKKTSDLTNFSTDSKYRRINYRSNLQVRLSNRLTAHLILGGTIEDKSNPFDNNTSQLFNSMAIIPPNTFPVYNPNGTYGGTTLYSNPWGDLLENGMYTTNGRVLQTSFGFTEQLDFITPGLSATASIGFNNTFTGISNKSRTYERFALSKSGTGDIDYTKIGENTSLSGFEGSTDQWRSVTVRGIMNYTRDFGMNHIDALVLYNHNEYSSGIGILPYLERGVYGRFTFANNRKYIGEVSFGYDASNEFPKDTRWGLFPAISAGWIASNENFLKEVQSISYLKFRASYGMAGNDKIGGDRFMFYQNWTGQGQYQFGTNNANNGSIGEGKTANPNVTWEKQKQLNIGLEATLFKQIDIAIDMFRQYRYDILAKPDRVIPSFTGANLPDLNVGKVENKGIEGMVRFNSRQDAKLSYFIQLDGWYTKNKIIDNSEPFQVDEYLYRTGRPIEQVFRLVSVGFFESWEEINDPNTPRQIFAEVQPGDLKYKDQNGDGIIDQNDRYPVGKTGNITGIFTGGLEYKGFDLELLFQGLFNRNVYLSGNYFHAFQDNGKISEIALNRWTPETASTASYPRLSSENNLNNFQNSTFWMRNGDFVKLRSIELGYNLSPDLVERIGISQARIYMNGTNIFSIDKMDFSDPERIYGYPPARTLSLGLNFHF